MLSSLYVHNHVKAQEGKAQTRTERTGEMLYSVQWWVWQSRCVLDIEALVEECAWERLLAVECDTFLLCLGKEKKPRRLVTTIARETKCDTLPSGFIFRREGRRTM